MKQSFCPGESPSLLSPWRRRCQWLTTLLLLTLPWFSIDGKSVLRVDIPELSLYVFGQTLRIEELYIVLLFSLFITLAFLLVTMILGRVWCGWVCPQTTLTDIAEWCANCLGLSGKQTFQASILRKFLLQVLYLLLAFLVSCNLLWYFVEPLEFFHKLLSLQLHYASWITLLIVAPVVYFDLAFIQRLMCSEFCPYGRFQTVLADQATLVLSLPREELERCIKCNSCVRVCPMGIDIREGIQVACINCGRCLDACRIIMAKRSQPGLISYSFGTKKQGARALLNARTLLLSIVTMALFMIFAIAIYDLPKASLKISVSHTIASRVLKDGTQATFFNAWINNRSDSSESYRIIARSSDKKMPLDIKGKTFPVTIEDGGNVRIDFVLVTPVIDSRLDVEFVLLDRLNNELAITAAQVRKP